MEVVKVVDTNLSVILGYLAEVQPLEETSRAWVKATVDSSTATILLQNGRYAKERTAYAAYIGDKVVGFAISFNPDADLDLLHVHPLYRGKGVARELVGASGVRTVTVHPENTQAIALYKSLGLEIDYDEV